MTMPTTTGREGMERAVRFNTRCTTAVLALFVALLAGLGGYGWWRASRLLRPESLVETLERRIEKGYPEIRAALKRAAIKSAPLLAEKLSRRGRQAIPQWRTRLQGWAERKLDKGLDQASAFSAREFRSLLRDNRALVLKGLAELRDAPQATKDFVVGLEKAVEKWAGTDIQKDARLVLGFAYLLRYKLRSLDREEKELAPEERVERRIIRTLRAMEAQ